MEKKYAIPYGRQHITAEDKAAVMAALEHPYLTQGPQVDAFEKAFASYVGAEYAIAVSNGTAALHLCAMALNVTPGAKVITTPITFAASANCIRYCGGEVVFADIDPNTATLDINSVRQLLEASPKGTYAGIIPVDFAGYPVNLEAFRALADEYGLWIIEDACHAPGGFFMDSNGKEQRCGGGAYADLAIFSFHPVKHIASGEGGMITTNDKALYEKIKVLRTHGITKNPDDLQENHGGWYYEMQDLGYNYRIPDILCALGLSQLQRADQGIARRREIAAIYDKAFASSTAVGQIAPPADNGHAYHLYIVQVANRKEVYDHLRANGIYAQIHYVPVHTMPYYRSLEKTPVQMPMAEAYYAACISLPMYPTLTEDEQAFVIEQVLKYAK